MFKAEIHFAQGEGIPRMGGKAKFYDNQCMNLNAVSITPTAAVSMTAIRMVSFSSSLDSRVSMSAFVASCVCISDSRASTTAAARSSGTSIEINAWYSAILLFMKVSCLARDQPYGKGPDGVRESLCIHQPDKLVNRSRFRMLCELGVGLMRKTHRSHEIQTTSGMLLTTSAVHGFRIL
ncbi:hypothetical protein DND58_17270 [Pseudomonas syringae pv. pisi]|nr:hypothetical protein DND62_13555 [Pseudomonas syringae pv. pisi]PYD30396.1 hypothetical protein DND58_17270 [Pseudomonas syringae pv. pisi]QGL58585.1 hypothetical protein POR16_20690 [Pseudomonas coronafaciens pv. oryzae str. 1_6]